MAERWGEGVRGERCREEWMETGDGMREDGGEMEHLPLRLCFMSKSHVTCSNVT